MLYIQLLQSANFNSQTSFGSNPLRRFLGVFYFSLLFALSGITVYADSVTLGTPFQTGMVLQRGKAIKVWGESDPSATVTVTIKKGNTTSASVIGNANAQGDWLLELPSLEAGDSDTLIATSGTASQTLTDVVMGDVWITFGQSNMAHRLNNMQNNSIYIAGISEDNVGSDNGDIRCLKVTPYAALTPQEKPTVPPSHSSSGAMNWLGNGNPGDWSAVGAVFAYEMNQFSNVPTAIIWASWGATPIEAWMPEEVSTQLPYFKSLMEDYYQVGQYGEVASQATDLGHSTNTAALNEILPSGWRHLDKPAADSIDSFIRKRPNIIYNQMIHPFRNLGISGFVWYQGESNTGSFTNIAQYKYSLPKLITQYREIFQQGDLPFLGVQLPSFDQRWWHWFRESQDSLRALPNAYRAVTIDTGVSDDVHPTDKEQIGIRLARLAREHVFGESIDSEGPNYDSMSIDGNQVTISFSNAAGLTINSGSSPKAFEIAGRNQVFHNATTATISGTDVILSSTSVPNPVAVRYAWAPFVADTVNLVDGDGLPTAPFRTDDFPIPGLPESDPQAGIDDYTTEQNVVLSIPANGVLDNDYDLNNDPLTASLITPPEHGQLVLNTDGSFTYIPDSGFGGTDSFIYKATQGSSVNSEDTTVNLTISGQKTGYYLWKETVEWTGGNENYDGDPEGDGINNLLEYSLGLNPLISDTIGLPTISSDNGNIEYNFNNVTPGINYEVLLSTNLTDWTIDPPYMALTSEDSTPLVIPSTEVSPDGNLFIQLKVSETTD